jgi:hypothetical protein
MVRIQLRSNSHKSTVPVPVSSYARQKIHRGLEAEIRLTERHVFLRMFEWHRGQLGALQQGLLYVSNEF